MRSYEKLNFYRRTTQAAFIALVFLAPVLNIFRYDMHKKQLIVLGRVWSLGLARIYAHPSAGEAANVAAHFLLNAILPWVLALSIFPLLGYFTGRLFCGWLCPEGAMFELADFLSLKLIGRRSLYGKRSNEPDVAPGNKFFYGALALGCAVILPPLSGIFLTGYLIAPETIWHEVLTGNLSFGVKAGITGISVYMLVTSLLVRHVFCRYICGAGLMQALFGWVSPSSLRVKMDQARAKECTDCMGCEKACFMNVIPRQNKRDISCVNCGACIVACNKELGRERGLFDSSFGEGPVAPTQGNGLPHIQPHLPRGAQKTVGRPKRAQTSQKAHGKKGQS